MDPANSIPSRATLNSSSVKASWDNAMGRFVAMATRCGDDVA